ncbi:ABC transporter permease [Pasteurellaceae bacterium RH1A]|nr:ABC transporter permease [Pasteurellaceae bacterium RH1A]
MLEKKFLLGWAGLGLLVVLWQVGVALLQEQFALAALLSPLETAKSFGWLLGSGEIFPHLLASLKRILIGLALALAVGIPFGLLLGFSKQLEAFATPSMQFLRMISPLSWMPIVVMLLGIGDLPIYFLLAFATVWSLIIATASGVKSIDPKWLELGRSMAASKKEQLCHIIVPAIGSHVLSGLRVAIGIAWVILVPCEMLGVNEGLGYFILDTRDRLAYSELMAAIVLIGLVGWILDSGIRRLARS